MEIFGKIITTQDFEDSPRLEISLQLPNKAWSPLISSFVDTGFTGDILLSYNLFQVWLNKVERVIEDAEIGESINGDIMQLRSVDSKISPGDIVLPVVFSSHDRSKSNWLVSIEAIYVGY